MRGITPVNNNSQPPFGVNWTKDTVSFLKKAAPRLVEDDGFETAKQAITNLAVIGKRNDGITARMKLEGSLKDSFLDFLVSVKNEKIPYFVYGDIQSSIDCINGKEKNNAEILQKFSNTIMGQGFVESSNKVISETTDYIKKMTIKDKLKEKFQEFGEYIEEKVDDTGYFFSQVFSTQIILEKDKKPYKILSVIDMLEEALPLKQSKLEKEQTKALRMFIDQFFAPSKQ